MAALTRPAEPAGAQPTLPPGTWVAMLVRLLAIQGSWNYETLNGVGIAFCVEPALRLLPGGPRGEAYRVALARQTQYFNAHPYLASLAAGALARAELDGAPPARIERFRTAMCSPLGSVGDQLVWAGWLPFCSVAALAAFGLGVGPWSVVVFFLALYNVGHLALRIWGLRTGWRHGLQVAGALGNPVLRRGPKHVARAAALVGGVALPLVLARLAGSGASRAAVAGAVALLTLGLTRWMGRAEGWRLALGILVAFVLFSVARHA